MPNKYAHMPFSLLLHAVGKQDNFAVFQTISPSIQNEECVRIVAFSADRLPSRVYLYVFLPSIVIQN